MALGYFRAALWAGVVLVAFVGYGASIRRVFFADAQIGWPNEAAWGMALYVVLGGVLNAAFLISTPLILASVAAGAGLAIAEARKRWRAWFAARKLPRGWRGALNVAVTALVVAFTAIQYLYLVAAPSRSLQDDVRGYFAFPKQMLELGGIARDPFNAFRLATGLGGQSALHAVMLAACDFRNLHAVEAIATVISVGLLFCIAERKKLGWFWRAALVLVFLGFPSEEPPMRMNTSSVATGMAMFLALFEFLDRDDLRDEEPVRNASIVALLCACAFALKTNLIPFFVVIVAFSYFVHLAAVRFKPAALLETVLVPVLVLAMISPWMVALWRSSGTLLHPVFGRGFDEYVYGHYLDEGFAGGLTVAQKFSTIWQRFSGDVYSAIVALTALVFVFARLRRRGAAHAFALGSIVAAILILLRSDLGNFWPLHRYLFAAVFMSVLIAAAESLAPGSRRFVPASSPSLPQRALAFLPVAATALVLAWCTISKRSGFAMSERWLHRVADEMRIDAPFFPETEREEYRKAQASVPAGEPILSRDNHTLLFDSARNPIYNLNDPGACSPPPGMPYFEGPEAVASYLRRYGIRYVAYEYATQAAYPVGANLWRHRPGRPYSHRVLERAKVALDRVLGELGASRRRVYDDGTRFIIDLDRKADPPIEFLEPNYFQMGKILVLAWARTQGFDRYKVWTDGHGVVDGIRYDPDPHDSALILNTFGYRPWNADMKRLRLSVSVNGIELPFAKHQANSYYFHLDPTVVHGPVTRIVIDSSTFVPRADGVQLGRMDDTKPLGIDVDTIEIR